jgi:hypothetical protein
VTCVTCDSLGAGGATGAGAGVTATGTVLGATASFAIARRWRARRAATAAALSRWLTALTGCARTPTTWGSLTTRALETLALAARVA